MEISLVFLSEKYIDSKDDNLNFLKERTQEMPSQKYVSELNVKQNEETFGYNFYDSDQFETANYQEFKILRPLIEEFGHVGTVGILVDEFDENRSNSEDEGVDDYKKGGYHPVFRGEVLNGRYVIIQKLGWGHFSTVWLSRDVKYNTYVAIKIQKSASHYLEAAFDEVEILQKAVKENLNPEWVKDLKGIYGQSYAPYIDDCHVVQLLNAFIYQGPYGKHFSMVFEILGVNLLEIIKRYEYKGIPLSICKEISKQVLIGLHYLHKFCNIIHTDLKPENVMVCLNPKELEEIITSGQLNNSKKVEQRLLKIKNRIRGMKGFPELSVKASENEFITLEQSPLKIEEIIVENQEQIIQDTDNGDNQKAKEQRSMNGNKTDDLISNVKSDPTDPSSGIEQTIPFTGSLKKSKQEPFQNHNSTNKSAILNSRQNDNKAIKDSNDQIEVFTSLELNKKPLKTILDDYKISNEEDLNLAYEKIVSAKNLTNKKDKKKLKKKLKKELKSNIQIDIKKDQIHPEHSEQTTGFHFDKKSGLRFSLNHEFIKSGLTDGFRIKIADLGNGCWVHHHFQPEIQTRQYRAPETILGANYNERTDIWSFACMLFEMLTGEFLFDPKKNENWSKSSDHLYLMMRTLNKFPKTFSTVGTRSKKYFEANGEFKKLAFDDFRSMEEILIVKYNVQPNEAKAIQSFLLPMLEVHPEKRISAFEALRHPWLKIKENEQLNNLTPELEMRNRPEFKLLHKLVVNEEEFDADKSNMSAMNEDDFDEKNVMTTDYELEIKYFDRNFKNYYVGYADGIDLNALDNTKNVQFGKHF